MTEQMNQKPWTEEEDVQLRELEAQGYSYSLIGERMGRSRSSVLAHAFRLRGYRRAGVLNVTGIKAKPRPTATIISKSPPRKARSPRRAPVPLAGDTQRMIGVFELTEKNCRWPHGERVPYLFCGAPRMGVECSYCEGHARIGFRAR
jgi:hypothetical protein